MGQHLHNDPGLRVDACNVGRGVFAGRLFAEGERLLVFHGRRFRRADPIHETDAGANLLQTGPRSYILPEPPGVLVNHSCNPNAGIRGNLELVALREIRPGEEIRFDYSTTMDEDLWTMRCLCGEVNCRRVVGDYRHLSLDVRSRYEAMGIVPAFVLRQRGKGFAHPKLGIETRR